MVRVQGNPLALVSLTGGKFSLTQWWWIMRRRREVIGRSRRWRGSSRLDDDVEALEMVLLNVEN